MWRKVTAQAKGRQEAVKAAISQKKTTSRAKPTDSEEQLKLVPEESVPEESVVGARKVAPVRDALYFDAAWYLSTYPDVAEAGVDAVTHYRTNGFLEGRQPNALFNQKAYLEANPDLEGFEGDLFLHYVFFGAFEGRPLSL